MIDATPELETSSRRSQRISDSACPSLTISTRTGNDYDPNGNHISAPFRELCDTNRRTLLETAELA